MDLFTLKQTHRSRYAVIIPGYLNCLFPAKKRVQSSIKHFFGLLNSSATNEDAARGSNSPYQSKPADNGLTSLVLLKSHLDMTFATAVILSEFATEARRLRLIV